MSETSQAAARKVALADVPANRRRGGDIRVVLGPKTAGATTGFLGVLTLAPGEFVSEHYHPYSEEFLYVTSGSMTVVIDGEPVEAAAEEGVLVPINARHRVVNSSDVPATAVFHLCPLAPEPGLGHVDTEELPNPDAPHPEIAAR
ncbi:cupin domain-containing protein [Streptomyces sp. NPDC020742]|uniref:cupin domain-containing protein n=1 Tax=unclassified Streptomyces TaxID=2593676 RepID=UPI0033F7B68B